MLNEMHDRAKAVGVDITSDARFIEAGALWGKGQLWEASKAVNRLLDQIKDEKLEAAIASRADELYKEKMRETGVHTMDSGGSTGAPPAPTPDKLDKLWVDFERQHPGEKNPYDADYRRLLSR